MLDWARAALRSAIGAAESVEVDVEADVTTYSPTVVEGKLDEAIAAVHRAAEAAERQIDVLDGLARSLVPLTESVTRLTDQLNALLEVMAPIAAAEHEASRLSGLLHRHRPAAGPGEHPAD